MTIDMFVGKLPYSYLVNVVKSKTKLYFSLKKCRNVVVDVGTELKSKTKV